MNILYKLTLSVLALIILPSCSISTLKFYPSVNGVVLNNEQSVKNAKITFLILNEEVIGNNFTIRASTSSSGKFSFPESSSFMITGPHIHRSEQILLIEAEGKTYIGLHGIRDYMTDFEDGLTVDLICDIKNKQSGHTINNLNGNNYLNRAEVIKPKYSVKYKYNGICITNQSSSPTNNVGWD